MMILYCQKLAINSFSACGFALTVGFSEREAASGGSGKVSLPEKADPVKRDSSRANPDSQCATTAMQHNTFVYLATSFENASGFG
jgi:hypothetical protein